MTDKTTKAEAFADPLAERKRIMGQHLGTKAATNNRAGKPESQQTSKELMEKVTIRLPASLHARLERIQLAIKQERLDQPKNQRRVLLQDIYTEAVAEYVKKMERKYHLG